MTNSLGLPQTKAMQSHSLCILSPNWRDLCSSPKYGCELISYSSLFILFLNVGLVGRHRFWLEVSMSICNAGLWESELEIHGRTIFKNTKCKAKLTTRETIIETVSNRHTSSRFSLFGVKKAVLAFLFSHSCWLFDNAE